MKRIAIIDSHTGGEPTRVVISGGPDLGAGSVADRLKVFRDRHDRFRSAVVNEPRGSDVLVGALLVASSDKSCVAGVIFFNNVGYLGMCGHGTIGLMVTLAHIGKIGPGEHRLETPVGVVRAVLNRDGSVSVSNVDSYRKAKDVAIDVPGAGLVKGDVAWGGNWFYLVTDHGQCLELANVEQLTNFTWEIRQAVNAQGFPEVDHVELFGPPRGAGAHSRNFVLCPGNAYDRSPCGTGTSAKLACLAADRKLVEGNEHVVESIIGSRFVGKFTWVDRAKGIIAPNITGTAHVNAETTLLLDEHDPYCWGIGDGARVSNPPGPRKSIPREEARGGTEGAAACNAFRATPGSPERLPVSGSRLGQSRSERVRHPRSDADYVRELVAARQARHSPTIPDAEIQAGFKGWHSRGYLPHFDRRGVYQFLTIRLADALPQERRREWSELLKIEDDKKRFTKVETYLDKGYGRCELRIPEVAALVQTALLKFDGERYRLLGWCIMPNHLHVLVEVTQVPLKKILHSWKAFTSLQANRLLGRTGAFWQADYFDRFMRDGEHLQKTLRYIAANPVKAGLVKDAREWEWGSARFADPQIDCHAGVQPATRLAIVAGDKEG